MPPSSPPTGRPAPRESAKEAGKAATTSAASRTWAFETPAITSRGSGWKMRQATRRQASAIAAVRLRYDPVDPSLSFEPDDPADPLRIAVTASDRHSGVASGEIEMRREGTQAWHGLETRREEGRLVAYVDDERFGNGVYEFRAHATDRAGNDSSIGPRDAGAATLRLPVRGVTRLRVGARKVKIRKRVIRQGGRRRTVKRRVVTLSQRVTARLGRSVHLHGRLLNEDGQPLEGAAVQVLDDASGRARLLATVQAGSDGWFRYRLRANHNRTIRFRYPGSRRIGAAESTVRLTVPAASTINVKPSQVFNGGSVEFRGRVQNNADPAERKTARDAGVLQGPLEDVLDCALRPCRPLVLPVSVRWHDRPSSVPVPRAAAGRGRVPVRHRYLTRRARTGHGSLG